MTFSAETFSEACEQADRLRRLYAGTDWVVRIQPPLFAGDRYRIVID